MKRTTIIWGAVIIVNSILITLIALNYYKDAGDDSNFSLLKKIKTTQIGENAPVDFDKLQPLCVVYFEADCNLCQLEIKAIFGKIDAFKQADLLFIASADSKLNDVKAIMRVNNVKLNNDIHFLYDKSGSFATLFKTQITPTLFVYNHKHLLVKRANGAFNVDKLLEFINRQ